MPKRIATISVTVIRENDAGKRVRKTIEPQKPYNFTDAEIEQITAMHPTALRKPVNETAVEVEEPEDDEDEDEDGAGEGEGEGEGEGGGEPKPAKPKKPKAKPKAAASDDDDI